MLLTANSIETEIKNKVKRMLSTYLPTNQAKELDIQDIIQLITCKIQDDLFSFASKDPAAKKSPEYILEAYKSFQAVLSYRIANALYNCCSKTINISPLQIIARQISEEAKVTTGIEIHPAANIGCRFVIDHGYGTVIGETAEIGDDCYLLQGVILGAREIAANHITKRHPTLGNRVEVGGFARIFGAVTIGDDVKISPCVVITKDVPAKSKVILVTTNLIIKK